MTLSANRWHVIAESSFPWEREALEWLRAQLPDRDPWHVWTNFEFIDDEGKVNEVDALALTPAGLFIIEIKSRPGSVSGDAHTWTWSTDGRERSVDNPLLLTDRKSKRLASLLRRQRSVMKAKIRLPFIEPLVFLSSTTLHCKLQGHARSGVFLRGRPGDIEDNGIIGALSRGVRPSQHPPVDSQQVYTIARGLTEAGIRPSNKHRQVGDYQLIKMIVDGPSYQEWVAQHVSVDVQRRVRIYNLASATSPEERQARVTQAQREFKILEGIEHSGILRCRDYKDTELGPALIFDHDPKAVRLDHLIRDHGQRMHAGHRLALVRQIAEVLKFAHSRRLFHRALGPQSVLVRGVESGELNVQLMNWQTAAREAASPGSSVNYTTGTQHVEAYVDDPGLVYLAPETTRADPAHGAELDIFSLGCLTYLIFSGQAPATSTLELADKLRLGPGLRLSDVLDGCSTHLHELVQFATNPEVVTRYDTVRGFLDDLDKVEDELTAPDPERTVDPSRAGPGDRIDGSFTVVKRLGRGSSSDALLVRPDGSDEELVLKVAVDASRSENLEAEADALGKLQHANIVGLREKRTVAGRTALLLKRAGEETLAQKLKREGRLSLDMLQRFGEELIDAVRHIEDAAVIHRDIKPDNIGITESRTKRLKLVLFDFSLTRTPAENLTAGTPPYLDPFLSLRPHRRWDLSAERFAAAVTLYEMAVGKPPRWGDGRTAPAMLDVEVTIESDVFDPVVRQPLAEFFSKALRRDFRERHDNAEEMLRAWRHVFERASTTHPPATDSFEAIALTTTIQTTMAELGYSLEAQDVLERMGIHNARELLAVDRIRFRYLRGVGDKIRKEIRLKAKELAYLRPDLTQGRGSLHTAGDDDGEDTRGAITVNELAEILLPRRPAGDDRPEEAALAYYLGLDDEVPAGDWPTLGDASQASHLDRGTLTTALIKARERWLKNKAFTELRTQLDALLTSQGQVMTAHEVAFALLALRGCAIQEDAERLRLACAVTRAALEAESHLDKPRFEIFEHSPVALVATSQPWADYARHLGTVADTCALADPLMPPGRVLEALEAVSPPTPYGIDLDADDAMAIPPIASARLLRLATMASRQAALSSRQEIYPRGMSALMALKQSMGALIGAVELKIRELQDRVHGRYPEADPLPKRPDLDRLLEEAGAPLQWDQSCDHGAGAYRRQSLGTHATVGPTTRFVDYSTADNSASPRMAVAVADARAIEDRLQHSLKQGGLLVLTTEPRIAQRAEAKLLQRFGTSELRPQGLERLSVDALLLRELRAQAAELGVDWSVVLRADGAEPGSRDWRNLLGLVKRTVPALMKALLDSPAPLLVVNAGLLARYDLMSVVSDLEATAGRPGRTPAVWLLLPCHEPGVAFIDATPVPLVSASAVTALTQPWVDDVHRAAVAVQAH
ncbi:BREX system serine/threonine kinase PglW [Paraburkholderia susongensis]|uniref:Serine/threonine protein kinase n=1 Tax=Paraburkholderia susongensis TaxID=1515439 RepID=A0A1X7K1S6_9BURK|nr:BREX system serine/threonine kinase PglW [Paraburkholderia susongensis]SMG34832.1 serine/threonine protein kinase [Paraburkholderia susongensis]